MRFIVTICILLLNYNCLTAQYQDRYWHFGFNVCLDFYSGEPISIPGSAMVATEGSATQCDEHGNLLFYTNGVKVFNKLNQLMDNGDSIGGHISSRQSVVIVPDPGNPVEYYLFTTDAYENQYQNGLCWSKINMTASGGLGKVIIKKQTLIQDGIVERLIAAKKPNCLGYWLITYQVPKKYIAIPIDQAGIQLPLYQNIGIIEEHPIYKTGELIMNNSLSTIINYSYYNSWLEILQFNPTTGVFSAPYVIDLQNVHHIYGVSFYNDSTFLVSTQTPSRIYKFVFHQGSTGISITMSDSIDIGFNPGQLSLLRDDKIYIGRDNKKFISSVNCLNNFTVNCLHDTAVNLLTKGKGCFPNQVVIPSPQLYPPTASFTANVLKVCPDSCISFKNNSCDAYAFEWFFEGAVPAYSTEKNPQNICYPTSGNFGVMLVAHHGAYSDTAYMPGLIEVYAPPVFSIEQNGNTLTCSLSGGSYGYQWYYNGAPIAGANGVSYTATMDGTYTLVVSTAQLCKASQSINVTVTGIADVEEHCEVRVQRQQSGAVQLKNQSTQEAVLRLSDISGRVVLEEKLQPGAQTQVMPATQGMYFLQISCGHQSRVMKIVGYP